MNWLNCRNRAAVIAKNIMEFIAQSIGIIWTKVITSQIVMTRNRAMFVTIGNLMNFGLKNRR